MHQGILSPFYIFNNDAYFLDFPAQKFPLIFFYFKSLLTSTSPAVCDSKL